MKDEMNIMRDSMAAVTENKLPEILEENNLLFFNFKVMRIIDIIFCHDMTQLPFPMDIAAKFKFIQVVFFQFQKYK